jgi:hypothetical protein
MTSGRRTPYLRACVSWGHTFDSASHRARSPQPSCTFPSSIVHVPRGHRARSPPGIVHVPPRHRARSLRASCTFLPEHRARSLRASCTFPPCIGHVPPCIVHVPPRASCTFPPCIVHVPPVHRARSSRASCTFLRCIVHDPPVHHGCSCCKGGSLCPGRGSRWQVRNERSHRIAWPEQTAPAGAAEHRAESLPPLPGREIIASGVPVAALVPSLPPATLALCPYRGKNDEGLA